METSYFHTSSIWDEWHRWKSRSTSTRRHITSIATVRTGSKVVVWFYAMLLPSAKRPRPPCRWEYASWETIWDGKPFQWQIIPFGAVVEYHPTSPKDQARIHQYGKKVLPGIFLGNELIAGGIWKGYIRIADLEELSKLDATDFYLRRINVKELLIRQRW